MMNTNANPDHADKRKCQRVEIPEHPKILDAHNGGIVGQLVNLSLDGLMLVSPVRIEFGTVFQMRIPLVKGQQQLEILLGAESLWCEDANDSGTFWTGFQIIDISPSHREILDSVVGA